MKWEYYINLYVHTYCLGRGLAPSSLVAYEHELVCFQDYMMRKQAIENPCRTRMIDIHSYMEFLRKERNSKNWAVKRSVCVLKGFIKFLVSRGFINPDDLPTYLFPRIKNGSRVVKDILSRNEIKKILKSIGDKTVIDIRDKTIIYLLYSTGMRAGECEKLTGKDIDIEGASIKVRGKGGHERTIPLVKEAVRHLKRYLKVRGEVDPDKPFFKSRLRTNVTRKVIYQRLKIYVRRCRIFKRISPHNLRHTFARHAVESGMNVVCLRDLLGHKSITSTQQYISINLSDLRKAIEEFHPVKDILTSALDYLPDKVRLNFQRAPS